MDRRSQDAKAELAFGFWFFLLWCVICLALFVWKIKPQPNQDFLYLLYSLKDSTWTWPLVLHTWLHHALFLLSFLGSLITFCGTGNRILGWFGFAEATTIEKWIWSLALGFGFWGLLAEVLAFENLFYLPLLRAAVLLGAAWFLLKDQKGVISYSWPFKGNLEIPSSWIWPILAVFFLSLSNLLVPEMSWDAITYQLILPKFYFLHHGFYPVTGIVPANYPSLGQMIFSWGLLWDNDSLARSFCFLAHLGTAFGLVAMGSRLFDSRIGWTAGVFYWVIPYLNFFSTRGYVDLFTGFYAVLGLGYLLIWKREGEAKNSQLGILGAIALGLIWAVKYNALSFWLAGLLIFSTAPRDRKTSPFVAAWFWGAPLFFFGPWALKSWDYTSNPVYPHLTGLFHTFDWTDFDAKASAIKFHIEGLKGLLQLPLLPWTIFFQNYGGAPNEELSLVPLVLFPGLAVWMVLKWKDSRLRWPFLAAVGIPFFFWLVTTHQLRLMSATMALACLPLAAAYHWMVVRWNLRERFVHLSMACLLWVNAFYFFQGLANQPTPFACFLGFQTRAEFLNRVLRPNGYVAVAQNLNQTLPPDARVLIIGQQNGYYLDRISAYDFDYTYPVLKKWSEKSETPQQLYKRFKENGFTHILYNSNAMLGTAIRVEELGVDRYPWKPQELKSYEQFFLKFTRKIPLPVGNGYSLYAVEPREGFSSLPEFLPGTEDYYVRNMLEIMGLPHASDIVGRPIGPDVYLRTYKRVADQHGEIGLPCFQWAFGTLGASADETRQALEMGREGFKRNGDEAAWDTLQGDNCLARKKNEEAIQFLERARFLSPEREDVARNLVVAYYNEHQLQKAVEEADRAAALAPFSQEYQRLAVQLRALAKPQ